MGMVKSLKRSDLSEFLVNESYLHIHEFPISINLADFIFRWLSIWFKNTALKAFVYLTPTRQSKDVKLEVLWD